MSKSTDLGLCTNMTEMILAINSVLLQMQHFVKIPTTMIEYHKDNYVIVHLASTNLV